MCIRNVPRAAACWSATRPRSGVTRFTHVTRDGRAKGQQGPKRCGGFALAHGPVFVPVSIIMSKNPMKWTQT